MLQQQQQHQHCRLDLSAGGRLNRRGTIGEGRRSSQRLKALDAWFTTNVSATVECNNHRLNGSSSSVLTATSLSYGKAKNSTPHRIKTPDPIEIKFGTVNYVGEGTRHAKFYANPPKGGFPANGWNIRKNFYSYPYTFFLETHSPTGQTLRRIFARDGSNDAVSRKDVPFGG